MNNQNQKIMETLNLELKELIRQWEKGPTKGDFEGDDPHLYICEELEAMGALDEEGCLNRGYHKYLLSTEVKEKVKRAFKKGRGITLMAEEFNMVIEGLLRTHANLEVTYLDFGKLMWIKPFKP